MKMNLRALRIKSVYSRSDLGAWLLRSVLGVDFRKIISFSFLFIFVVGALAPIDSSAATTTPTKTVTSPKVEHYFFEQVLLAKAKGQPMPWVKPVVKKKVVAKRKERLVLNPPLIKPDI